MLKAEDIHELSVLQRKAAILKESLINAQDSAIEATEKTSNVINTFIKDYFDILSREDAAKKEGSILIGKNLQIAIAKEMDAFAPGAIRKLQGTLPTRDSLIASAKNPYELSGAVKLSFANKATRSLSTTMGLLWEKIANISPMAINPEIEFAITIKGIDLIARNIDTGEIEYQQLKTQRNTLTGSQTGRSVEELSIHENPVFCACFSLNSWTFNHHTIPRVSGEEFWRRIGIDYSIFEGEVKKLILNIEREYVSLLRT